MQLGSGTAHAAVAPEASVSTSKLTVVVVGGGGRAGEVWGQIRGGLGQGRGGSQ